MKVFIGLVIGLLVGGVFGFLLNQVSTDLPDKASAENYKIIERYKQIAHQYGPPPTKPTADEYTITDDWLAEFREFRFGYFRLFDDLTHHDGSVISLEKDNRWSLELEMNTNDELERLTVFDADGVETLVISTKGSDGFQAPSLTILPATNRPSRIYLIDRNFDGLWETELSQRTLRSTEIKTAITHVISEEKRG